MYLISCRMGFCGQLGWCWNQTFQITGLCLLLASSINLFSLLLLNTNPGIPNYTIHETALSSSISTMIKFSQPFLSLSAFPPTVLHKNCSLTSSGKCSEGHERLKCRAQMGRCVIIRRSRSQSTNGKTFIFFFFNFSKSCGFYSP